MQLSRKVAPFLGLATLAALVIPAAAAPTLSLSSATNLNNLTVGQQAVVIVTLSGLPSPNTTDFVFNLDSHVLFPSSLLTAVLDPTSASGLTTSLLPGSVFAVPVQGSLQAANFQAQSTYFPGSATGNFSQSPNTNSGAISLNGVYYTFTVQAKAAGNGSISFDPAPAANQYAANDSGFNFDPLPSGSPLSFTISPATISTPEPSTFAAFGFVGLFAAGLMLKAGKRKAGGTTTA